MSSLPEPADIDPKDVDATGELMARARRVLAYGGLDGIVQRPLYYDRSASLGDRSASLGDRSAPLGDRTAPLGDRPASLGDRSALGGAGVFPQFAVAAEGCHLTDSTGQTFVDWVNGWGPVLLGYRHPKVEAAIRAQLAAGPILSLMHPVEVEVAEALHEMIPCAHMVAFGKNGSDALEGAARIARVVTGREMILQYGMHGFHDWFVFMLPHVRGVPSCLRDLVGSFPYNDLDALAELLERHRGRVAGIVMEPVREIMPDPGYLAGVKELAHEHGALLVWDEVLTALRLGPAGAQGAFGVEPDIACLGKSLGNGMPISAIVGRREYMQHLPSVGFGMTFRGDTLSLAATRAVLEIVRTEPVAEHVSAVGERLRAEFRALCRELDVPWDLTGPPARMSVRFAGRHAASADDLRDLFLQECLKRGVFTNGNFLPSYAHDDAAIAETVRGVRGALEMVAAALKAGEVRGVQPLGGFPQGPRAHVAQGFVEGLHDSADGVHVGGWMLLADGAPDSIEIGTSRGIALTAARVQRPDIAQAFPRHTGALSAGFSALVPAASLDGDADQEFTILARRGGDVAFRCRVVRRRRAGETSRVEGPYWIGDGVLYV